jgi:hypothetical protein
LTYGLFGSMVLVAIAVPNIWTALSAIGGSRQRHPSSACNAGCTVDTAMVRRAANPAVTHACLRTVLATPSAASFCHSACLRVA